MPLTRILLLALAIASVCPAGELFKDDFSRFPPRIFSAPVKDLTNAIQEYHYLPHRGVPLAPWANAIVHQDAWAGGDEDGIPYLEQHLINDLPKLMNPLMITGDPEWSDYTVEVKVRPLSLRDMAGVAFRYRTNRHYYLFALEDGKRARLRLRLPMETAYRIADWKDLGTADFIYDTDRYYKLKVESSGARIRAFIDDKLMLEASDGEILAGKVGLTSNYPARFQAVRVTAPDAAETGIRAKIAKREAELARLRADNPKPRLWKKFETPKFGAHRNARFGDLDGDGRLDMLIAQNTRKASRNSFAQISCLTAVTFDGRVLWQIGRPEPYNDVIAHDTPFQIHDLDGDGRNEVILIRDFKIQVLEGATGKLRQSVFMPKAPEDNKERPYEREVGDSILFVNFSGKSGRREMIVKDRYRTFWVYSNDLQLLWSGQGQIGHYPYPYDVDGDGREEIAIGYAMWNGQGRQLWSHDKALKDHADGIVIGNFSGDPQKTPRVYGFGSDEGFLMFDLAGTMLKHLRIGHAQTPSVAKYRPDLPGLQLMTVNFWKNPGIITLFDHDGNILAQEEPIHSGSALIPVNWRGDGQEFAMLSGNVSEGGMIDGRLRRVVMFPDDGHPDLTFTIADVTGDARDEVILWDEKQVWIYTQDRPFAGSKIYAPIRNPDYNDSNYRTTVSIPNWK